MGELIAERSEAHTQSNPAETHDEDGGRHYDQRKKEHAIAPTIREERCERSERGTKIGSSKSDFWSLRAFGISFFLCTKARWVP